MGVRFSRAPYKVTYMKDGVQHTIRRRPPPKLHDMEVQDEVRLVHGKNDDFKAGETLTVKGINPRQPNVLHLVNEDGLSTFVDYYDAKLETMRGPRNGMDVIDLPINNRYLLWP
ncbi:hypothetical protein [Oligoflexus tunisiensis]|uniref:hypothetical protein n=1 Tax=Oligoflexus tunisiensis TaxID=708132 RepID=UPI00114CF80A|nr:hypothetical protein [Oligoflexus tunisiensis]